MPPDRLVIPPGIRRRLVRAARAAGDLEVCGALIGRHDVEARVDRVTDVRPLPNRADDPRRSFVVDPASLAPVLRGEDVVGFYHSHPRGGTRASERDARGSWPGWWTVIVDPRSGRVAASRPGRRVEVDRHA